MPGPDGETRTRRDCPLCASSGSTVERTIDGWDLSTCDQCGFLYAPEIRENTATEQVLPADYVPVLRARHAQIHELLTTLLPEGAVILDVGGATPTHWIPPEHINYFTPASLRHTLDDLGLVVRPFGFRALRRADWRYWPRAMGEVIGVYPFGLNVYGVRSAVGPRGTSRPPERVRRRGRAGPGSPRRCPPRT